MSKIITKPWGKEVILVKTKKYVVKKLMIDAGKRLSYQYHKVKDETVYVMYGILECTLGNKTYTFFSGDCIRIKPKEKHRFAATCGRDVMLLECSTPQLADVVRISDDYGRTRKTK